MNRLVCPMPIGVDAYSDAAPAMNNGRYTIVSFACSGGTVAIVGLVAHALRDQNIPLAQFFK